MKRAAGIFLCVILLAASVAGVALADGQSYSDMPEQDWAREAVEKSYEYGLMEGIGNNRFGSGMNMNRAEFVTVLVRMFGWEIVSGGNEFGDISGHWAAGYINTAAEHDVVTPGGSFRPNDPITRREMSVMLVRALGYGQIAEAAGDWDIPFTDVDRDRGYITVAYDIGTTNGTSDTTFEPERTAIREQAAAMLVRVYERYISDTQWSHAFYAISSYSQLELAKSFDAVTLGWSRMVYDGSAAPYINTTTSGGNEYYVPSGYASVINELRDAGVKLHLGVVMNTSGNLASMLSDAEERTQAVEAIVAEATRVYDDVGYSPYSGVTIDFEGLRASQKGNFTAFIEELDRELETRGMTLYVAVMPATEDGIYYDGYDYRAIGEAADKVILMAHDYAATDLSGFLNSSYYRNTALTPIESVYYSLRKICDQDAGVQDRSKITLAISLSSLAWETDDRGLLINETPMRPNTATIYSRLTGGAQIGWSDTYWNPYATYTTESGQNIFLWYEDQRSVEVKADLARMFGVTGVSVWRLGLIPNYDDSGIYYNVMDAIW